MWFREAPTRNLYSNRGRSNLLDRTGSPALTLSSTSTSWTSVGWFESDPLADAMFLTYQTKVPQGHFRNHSPGTRRAMSDICDGGLANSLSNARLLCGSCALTPLSSCKGEESAGHLLEHLHLGSPSARRGQASEYAIGSYARVSYWTHSPGFSLAPQRKPARRSNPSWKTKAITTTWFV